MWQIINSHIKKKQQKVTECTLLPDETNDYFVTVVSGLLKNLKTNKIINIQLRMAYQCQIVYSASEK